MTFVYCGDSNVCSDICSAVGSLVCGFQFLINFVVVSLILLHAMPREMYRYNYTHNYTYTSSLFTEYRISCCQHAHQIFPMLTAPQKTRMIRPLVLLLRVV